MRYWDQGQGRYEEALPKASHVVGKLGHSVARTFQKQEEATAFFGQENASPLRMHLVSGSYSALFKAKALSPRGAPTMCPRDDGWGLRDSEGWYRYRHCRPITIRDLVLPKRNKGFIGWPGDHGETSHTMAVTQYGRRFHLEENWQVHEESTAKVKERVSCLQMLVFRATRSDTRAARQG